jgi:hypothetical protein
MVTVVFGVILLGGVLGGVLVPCDTFVLSGLWPGIMGTGWGFWFSELGMLLW